MAKHSVIVLRFYIWQKFQEKYWQCKYTGHTKSHKQINFTIKNRYEHENATRQICALYSLLYKIPILISAFLSPFWKSGDSLASELCFSSLWTTMHGFLDSHFCHNLLASDLIFYKPEEMVVKETWVKTVMWMGSRLPNILLNPLYAQRAVWDCALSCCRIPVTECVTKLLEHLKVTSSTDGIPLWHKLNHRASFSISKVSSHGLYGLRALFWPIFLAWCLWCHSMICHFLSRSKQMLQTKLSSLTAYCSTNHNEIFFHWSLCSSISKWEM